MDSILEYDCERKQITPTKTTQRLWRHAVPSATCWTAASLLRGIECWRNKTCQPTRSPDRAYEASPSALDTHTPSVNTRRISLDRHVGIDSAHARPLGSILQNHVFCQQVRFTGGILRSPSIFIIAASLYEVAFRGLYRLLPIPLNPRYPSFHENPSWISAT